MSSSIPTPKRDRLRNMFAMPAKEPSSARAEAAPENTNGSSTSTSSRSGPKTSHIPHAFLTDALKELTADERRIIEDHRASDIGDMIKAVYNAAAEQKAVCESKKWPGSGKAKKVLLWLDRFKIVGDIGANADPIHFGLPWAGIRMLLEVLEMTSVEYVLGADNPAQATVADSRQMMALVSGMDLALCIANRLRAYFDYFQRLPSALTTENFRQALVALYAYIFRFLAGAIRIFRSNSALRKVQAAWQDSDLEAFESRCNGLAEQADIEANNCDRDDFAQWKVDLKQTLQELVKIENLQDSLDSLHTKVDLSKLVRIPGATFDSFEEDQLPQCLDNTRIEVLRRIAWWADNLDGKCIFWLCGSAGTGKSTISRTVAQVLQEKKQLGASFFFKRGHSSRSVASCFFPTIVAQLADRIPAMQQFIAEALHQDSFLCSRNLQEQFDKLLLQPLRSVGSTQLPSAGLTIVIDALDECQRDTDVRKILILLSQVNAISSLRLCIFVASRPKLPIEIGFQKIDGTLYEDVVLEEAQATTIVSDLRTYFKHQFTEIKSEWALRRPYDALPADWPTQASIEALTNLAVPLFIFASTVCRFVAEKSPKKRLQKILEQQQPVASLRLQDEDMCLRLTYSQVLDEVTREKGDDQIDKNIQMFRTVVGPIVLLADPLSRVALSRLLQVDAEELDDVLEGLRSVLIVPRNSDDPVQTLHSSFREFLIDKTNTHNQKFRVDETQTHRRLAQQCLGCLAEPGILGQDILGTQNPGIRRLEVTSQQIRTQIAPEIVYACKYWPLHFINSDEQLSDNGLVHEFLKTHFLHWLEVLSWLGSLSSVIDYTSDLLSIAKGDNGKAISAFLEDAKRFVLKNRFAIDLAPLQVYHSAIIFTPTKSIVRQTFDEQVPKLWAQLPKVPSDWSAEILMLEGHRAAITAIAFSPDGRVVASAASNETLRLWNARSGEEMHSLSTHEPIDKIEFLENNQVVGLGWSRYYGFARQVWNAQTGEQLQKSEDPVDLPGIGVLSPDGQIFASSDHSWRVHLIDSTTGKQTHCLEGHIAFISALAFSPNGKAIASGSADGTIQVWDIKSAIRVYHLQEHKKRITDIAFAPDGQIAASASKDGTVQLWDVQKRQLTHKLVIQDGLRSKIIFSSDGSTVVSASDDQTVRLWDVLTGKQILKLEKDERIGGSMMPAVALSPVEQVVAVALHDRKVQLLNSRTGEQVKMLEQDSWVNALAFSPSGQIVASAGGQTVWLWNIQTRRWIRKLEHQSTVFAVSFFPSGQVVVSKSNDGTIRLWNGQTGEQTQAFETSLDRHRHFSTDGLVIVSGRQLWNTRTGKLIFEHDGHSEDKVRDFSQKSQTVALGSSAGILRLWDITGKEQVRKFEEHEQNISGIAFSRDGQIIATAFWDGTVCLWKVQAGSKVLRFRWRHNDEKDDSRVVLAFSPDGHVLAVSQRQTVQLWNTQTGKQMRSLSGHTAHISVMAFSPDGQIIAGASSGTFQLWNTQTGEHTQEYSGNTGWISAIAFSPDGQTIASASDKRTIRLWRTQHIGKVRNSEGHKRQISAVAFSPDGRLAASTSLEPTIWLLNPRTGKEIRKTLPHKYNFETVAFSPDGKTIAAAAAQGISLWDTQTGELRRNILNDEARYLDKHGVPVFSPNGGIIAAAAYRTVWLWNTQTGERIQTLEGSDTGSLLDRFEALAFSPDGNIVAAASLNAMFLWNVQTGDKMQESEKLHCTTIFSSDGMLVTSTFKNKALRLRNLATDKQTQLFAHIDIKRLLRATPFQSQITRSTFVLTDVSIQTTALELGTQWIGHQGRELLWLPPEYRADCSAVHGGTLIVGQRSGDVSFYRLA